MVRDMPDRGLRAPGRGAAGSDLKAGLAGELDDQAPFGDHR
jgi:hypothetical protein